MGNTSTRLRRELTGNLVLDRGAYGLGINCINGNLDEGDMTTGINDSIKCAWCGGFHPNKCPLVKAIEYHLDGSTKRVEFYTPKDYPEMKIAAGPR